MFVLREGALKPMLLSFPSFGPINCWQNSCFSDVERIPFIFMWHVLKPVLCLHVVLSKLFHKKVFFGTKQTAQNPIVKKKRTILSVKNCRYNYMKYDVTIMIRWCLLRWKLTLSFWVEIGSNKVNQLKKKAQINTKITQIK